MEKLPHHINGVYTLSNAASSSPLVLDSPHSGREYPQDFGYACTFEQLRKCEDPYVDLIFDDITQKTGTPFLKALFPRSYIDTNRTDNDIPLTLRPEDWPFDIHPTDQSDAGYGLIREILRDGTHVYDRTLSTTELSNRLDTYYRAYHTKLEQTLEHTHQQHGSYFHIDCHSFSGWAVGHIFATTVPDIILGDLDGTSCNINLRRAVQNSLAALGYRVTVNVPYKGLEIVQRYGDPARGRHSLQIEINKDLYLDNEKEINQKKIKKLQDDFEKMIQEAGKAATELTSRHT